MLRLIFVLAITTVGLWYAVRSPYYALLFYVWNAYFRPEAWVWDASLVAGLNLSYVAALIVVITSVFSTRRWPFNGHLGLIAVFAGQCVLSTSFSAYQTWPLLLEFLKLLVMTYMIVVLVDNLARLRMFLVVLALSLGFEAAKQGWFELFLHPGARNDNVIPFLGDNNGVAVGLWMLVSILGGLSQTTERQWLRRLFQAMLIGTAYRAVTTYSRGGVVAGAALAAVYWLRAGKKLVVMLTVVLVVGLVVYVMPEAFWQRMDTISEPEETQDVSVQGRYHFWGVALAMANAHPISGVGFRAYEPAYDTFDSSRGLFGSARAVHSVWFGVLAELGYPGLALYGLIFLLGIRNCRRVQRLPDAGPDSSELKVYAGALEGSLVAFMIGGAFLATQYTEMPWHCVGMTIALTRVGEKLARTERRRAATSPIQVPEGGS
jgi:probable O-glycosylation ligase (exosortase A-associated)